MGARIVLTLFMLMGGISCMDRQDFDQVDDINAYPIIEGSILYLELPEDLLNQAPVTEPYGQEFNFDGFSEDIFAERVLQGTVFYELENTTSKELEVAVEFLDEGGEPLDSQKFRIPPVPAPLTEKVPYGGSSSKSIEIIRNTSGIRITVQNLGDNTSVSSLPQPKVIIRSSGKFRMQLR